MFVDNFFKNYCKNKRIIIFADIVFTVKLLCMRMKRVRCFLLMACIGVVASVFAQDEAQEKAEEGRPLVGIWQMVLPANVSNTDFSLRYLPVFKVLNSDGTFCNMQFPGQGRRALFNQEGTYVIDTDSTYTERIVKSPHADYKGISNPLKYKVTEDKKMLFTQYWNPTAEEWMPEMWLRVETPEGKENRPKTEL